RSEQIPGESYHNNERIRASIFEVRKVGSRVKIILSRIRPQLVQRLFEQEIPEIADGVIEIRAISREPGYRSKVAVISSDNRIDCVGACVGVRGNRIKNIVEELGGERIDIVRWSDDLQVLVPNALQPAEIDEVILCQMLGRGIVLVREDQLSLAIGRRGQNVRLASKLCGWDMEIMTREELDQQIERAIVGFSSIEGLDESVAERLVGEGFLSYDDLSVIEPDDLMEMGDLSAEVVESIVNQAEERATLAEVAAADERRKQREIEKTASSTGEGEGEVSQVQEQVQESEEKVTHDESSRAESVGAEGSEASGGEASS
ncbi:MAG: transcription termination/antitermination protein NusA, partial [Pirellulales bacterium]